MILNAPEDDVSQVQIGQLVNFEDSVLQDEKKAAKGAQGRPKSAKKRPKTAKKKKVLEKIDDDNATAQPKGDQVPAGSNPAEMFPKARGLRPN